MQKAETVDDVIMCFRYCGSVVGLMWKLMGFVVELSVKW